MQRPTIAVLVVALVAVGCGSGDSDAGRAADEPTSTTHDHNAMQAAERGETPLRVDPDDRCDLGLNTEEFNDSAVLVDARHEHLADMQANPEQVDFTLEEWAEVFANPGSPVTPAAMASSIETNNPDFAQLILSGVFTHTLEPDSWVPTTDTAECEALADELRRARDAATRYPTAADALAAGYALASPYAPGQGSHFNKRAIIDGTFDPDEPEMLMYDSTDAAAHLMGMSYFVLAPEGLPDEYGFTGLSDQWHSHDQLCLNAAGVAVSPAECDAGRANTVTGVGGWMLHAWVVPGCESPWGMFSGANPRLPVLAPGATLEPGCGSGKSVTDRLELDDAGQGPTAV